MPEMMEEDKKQSTENGLPCRCFSELQPDLAVLRELGMDSHFGEVSLLVCPACSQLWLRYFYEIEAFTASGRWYRGAVSAVQAAGLAAENAKTTLEGLSWYIYGGSYYGGRSGRASGPIRLNP